MQGSTCNLGVLGGKKLKKTQISGIIELLEETVSSTHELTELVGAFQIFQNMVIR
jgi:hypothetical protein